MENSEKQRRLEICEFYREIGYHVKGRFNKSEINDINNSILMKYGINRGDLHKY